MGGFCCSPELCTLSEAMLAATKVLGRGPLWMFHWCQPACKGAGVLGCSCTLHARQKAPVGLQWTGMGGMQEVVGGMLSGCRLLMGGARLTAGHAGCPAV